jgi:hypothetical protein
MKKTTPGAAAPQSPQTDDRGGSAGSFQNGDDVPNLLWFIVYTLEGIEGLNSIGNDARFMLHEMNQRGAK